MPKLINRIIKVLIASDFFLNSGWGLMGPIFALFIVQNITVGNAQEAAQVAGFAALSYWVVKSLLQIPIARHLDKNHGEIDDYWFLVAGTFAMALVPLGYIFSTQPWHIYALQIFYAMAASIAVPSYLAIFTRHIDDDREAVEWSTWSTTSGIGAGIAGGIGGFGVATFGFAAVLLFVSAFTFLAGILLLVIRNDISPRNKRPRRLPIERKVT